MIVVVFEVTPKPGRAQDYFDLAAELRPELEKIDGFGGTIRKPAEGKYLRFRCESDPISLDTVLYEWQQRGIRRATT